MQGAHRLGRGVCIVEVEAHIMVWIMGRMLGMLLLVGYVGLVGEEVTDGMQIEVGGRCADFIEGRKLDCVGRT